MSILNVWIKPDRAIIACDTDVTTPDGTQGRASKALPLPHLNAVLGCRGRLYFLTSLFWSVQSAPVPDFDGAVDQMPKALSYVFNFCVKEANQAGVVDTPEFDVQTVVLVGWSPKRGRIVGWNWDQRTRAEGFKAQEITNALLGPSDGSLREFQQVESCQRIQELALRQVEITRRLAPANEPAGGSLFIFEMTKDEINIRKLCELPTRATA